MGIFDFFKKKKLEEQIEEKISFEEVNTWIEDKKEKNKEKQKGPLKQIKVILSTLLDELDEKMIVLRNLSLDEKKAPERAKLIVRENLEKFTYYLEKLILDLKEVDSNSLEVLISKINSLFSEFDKKSSMSFQKATFLIGKELEVIGESTSKFFKLFNKIIRENNVSIKQDKTILIVDGKLEEIKKLRNSKSKNNESINRIEEKSKEFESKIQELEKEIKEKKQTSEYIEQIEIKNKSESTKTKLLIEFQALKYIIDFKALAKIYHSIGNKMEMIKEYKEDFKHAFEKYGAEKLIDLSDIKEINKNLIKERIESIKGIKEEIKNIESEIKEDITLELTKEIKRIQEKIKELNVERFAIEKRNNKLIEEMKRVKLEIIEELEKIEVIVE